MNRYNLWILIGAGMLATVSCATKEADDINQPEPVDPTFAQQTEKHLIKVDTLFTEFESPWGMTWLSDGKMLVTERKGEILIFENDEFTGQKVTGLPEVHEVNQAGLLDVAAHPNHAENGWIYIAYAKPFPDNKGALTIMRFKLDDNNNAIDQEEIIVAMPEWEGGRHFGSRIVFDNEGYLYFSNGDKGNKPENAQTLTNAHGKVHRIHDDGRIPADNPFVNEEGAVGSIWSYGNRNPQGLYFDKANNRLWEAEHGPMGGDELNLIEKGKNYGWPVITYGQNYDGTPITEITEKEGMEQPVTYYVPSIATCGMTMVTSDRYPNWKGDILIGALAKMHINRVDMDGATALSQEVMFQDIGRVRQVSESPDGYLYAITEGTGLLVKLLPVE
ncbi:MULTISPECIES: PQQ-dependent sugar dehydrogenase [Algoriphagus]|jgi:Glucose/sorbosone dehydrogenases|uniref:PQQ-dependent sugar dehydrogenase n=2 Tax=Algoriphagus TaxID=246875 RepID=A0ABS7N6Z9_9BACT|nr:MULTISPECIES: PQQ-dependent sugar dehydrogenase [Algoriphagus]MBY5952102.1 PQQ-dependent sugar dehydrogenase [Algoriphagus marincola]TDK46658.1 PQQ-dependent sugar dehydrogenase [Algoriphagus aquimaris]